MRGLLVVALVLDCAACKGRSPSPRLESVTLAATAKAVDANNDGIAAAESHAAELDAEPRDIGPFSLRFLPKRSVYLTVPMSRATPQRLLANLHGLCNPPGYSCGYWIKAASEVGFLVCPEGNAKCGDGASAPPTWSESFDAMSDDLERAVEVTEQAFPDQITREGAVLTGFSRGAYAAPIIAARHPGRWPYLILVEADVTLSVPMLEHAGVRAVAMLAGEWGTEFAGSKKTCDTLAHQGYPIHLFGMPKAGHFYSADIDEKMRQALAFVLAHDPS
jgi:hypothetical protein